MSATTHRRKDIALRVKILKTPSCTPEPSPVARSVSPVVRGHKKSEVVIQKYKINGWKDSHIKVSPVSVLDQMASASVADVSASVADEASLVLKINDDDS